jgi:hypothetical protein
MANTPPDIKPPSDWIIVGGYAVNPAQISMIDLRKPDEVVVHVAANCLVAEGADADTIRALLPKPAEQKAAEHKAGEHPPLLAPAHKPDPNDPGRKPEPEPASHKSK